MIEFKKPSEIFRVNADATFELGKGVDPLVALGELSKAFMKQQDRIKRLEEAGDAVAAIIGPPGSAHWADENQVDAAWNNWTKAKEAKL